MPKSDPPVVRVLEEVRKTVLGHEAAETATLVKAWLDVEVRLRDSMTLLAVDIIDKYGAGASITPQLVMRMERYKILDAQIKELLTDYTKKAAIPEIAKEMAAYERLGLSSAVEAISAAAPAKMIGYFGKIPARAMSEFVALLSKGPVYDLLSEAYPASLAGVTKGLIEGLALGINPTDTATKMADGLGIGLNRIVTIARTEQLRVFRTSSIDQYRESGVVKKFKRLARKDEVTCLACLVSDGEIFELESDLSDHPRGRCAAVPCVIGAPEPTWTSGQSWIRSLDETSQREMLGEYYDPWKAGDIKLSDLRSTSHSEVWGDQPFVPSLASITGK